MKTGNNDIKARDTASKQREGKRADKPKGKSEGTRRNAVENGRPKGAFHKNQHSRADISAEQITPGDRIVVTIKRIGINGEGVGYYKRKAVFIEGALPGEVVVANVTKAERGYLNAAMIKLEKRSPDRQTPPCPVYDRCGGCQLQHMTYEAQLRAKEEIVKESFQRYAGLDQLPIRPIIGMDNPWSYRNKAQLQTGQADGAIVTGLYEAGSRQLVDISGCPIQHPVINEVIDKVKSIMGELKMSVYNSRTRKGNVRTLVARVGYETGKVQLTIITAEEKLPDAKRLIAAIREKLPMVTTIAHNVNKSNTPLIFGDKTTLLWGEDRLGETLGDIQFSLSPRAFFQLNPEQTVKLYNAVKEAADLQGDELLVDGYCGTGTIGLWLAPYAREIRGIEIIEEAVEDARENARNSGINNAKFYAGRAEELLPQWVAQGIRPDVIVVDPPRTGCELPLLRAIAAAKPKRLVYVSCNPSTLAKDCKVLLDQGYRLESVQPVDMFPQTAHVECVVGIQRIDT